MARPVRELLEGLGAKPKASGDDKALVLDAQPLGLSSVFGGDLSGEATASLFSDEAFSFTAPDELAQLGVFWVPHLERPPQLRAAIKDAHDRVRRRLEDEAAAMERLGFSPGLSPPRVQTRGEATLGGHRVVIGADAGGGLALLEVDGAEVPAEKAALAPDLDDADESALKERIGDLVVRLKDEGLLKPGRGAFDAETVRAPLKESDLRAARPTGEAADDDDFDDDGVDVDIMASAECEAAGDGLLPPPEPAGLSANEFDELAAALEEDELLDDEDDENDDDEDEDEDNDQDDEPEGEIARVAASEGPAAEEPEEELADDAADADDPAAKEAPAAAEPEEDDEEAPSYDEPTRVVSDASSPPKSGLAFRDVEDDQPRAGPSLGEMAREASGFDDLDETAQLPSSASASAPSEESLEESSEEAPPAGPGRPASDEADETLAISGEIPVSSSELGGSTVEVDDPSEEADSLEDASEPEMEPVEVDVDDVAPQAAEPEAAEPEADDDEEHEGDATDPQLPEARRRSRMSEGATAPPSLPVGLTDLASVVGEGLSTGKTGAIQLDAEAFAYLSRDDLAEAEALEQEAAVLESRVRELRSKAEMLRRRHEGAQGGRPQRSLAKRLEQQRLRALEAAPASAAGYVEEELEEEDAFASSAVEEGPAARDSEDAFSDGVALEDVQALLAEVGEPEPGDATQLHEVDLSLVREELAADDDVGGVFDDGGSAGAPAAPETRVQAAASNSWEDIPEAASVDVQLAASDESFAYTEDAATRVGPMVADLDEERAPKSRTRADKSAREKSSRGEKSSRSGRAARPPGPPPDEDQSSRSGAAVPAPGKGRPLKVALVVDDERALARLKKHLGPSFPDLRGVTSLAEAAELPELAELDAMIIVRPPLDGSTLTGFEMLEAQGRRPPTLVLSSDPGFDAVPGVDLRLELARRAGEVAQQVIDGLARLGVRR